MLIRAVIVDDEYPAVDKLARLLKDSGIVDIKGMFTDPLQALEYINHTSIDVAFLDIEMPEMSGMELANHMLELYGRNIAIVFVTAYDEYAVKAFRVNAVDYLMKPLDRTCLKETLDRIVKKMNITVSPKKARIFCFDKFRVMLEEGEVKFRTAKAEELLAFFIDRKGTEVTRNEIIDRIWPEFDGDRAVTNFNTTLYYMKKALLDKGIEIRIKRIRDRYQLDMDPIDCDYYKFNTAITHLNQIDDDNIVDFEASAKLYTGDYLIKNQFYWSERNRISIKEKYIILILAMTEYYRSRGQYNKSIHLLKNSLNHEPLHTDLNYELLKHYLLIKDKFSTVKHYNLYKKRLKEELGIKPNNKIEKLMYKIKA